MGCEFLFASGKESGQLLWGVGGSKVFEDSDLPAVLTHDLDSSGPGSGGDFTQARRREPIVDSQLVSHQYDLRSCDQYKRDPIRQITTQLWESGSMRTEWIGSYSPI